MADRTVAVRLEAITNTYVAKMAQATAATQAFGAQVAKTSVTHQQGMQTLGLGMTALGAAIGAGFGLAAKAAIDFESSFAGVRKTVEATEPQFQALAQGLRDMAKEIPVNVNELNAIAEAAGQLGIKRSAILSFTETVAKMGVTTDLTSDQAANAFARIGNIMGTAQDDFDRMGSTIVELGNKGAATESEIVEMGLRIAGAGKQIGLSEGQVLGFAESLASVGINAEAGGSAISRTFINIAQSVDEGGEKLETFARVAGMSTSEFSRMFEQDAAGAMIAFIQGLDRMGESGKSVFAVLDQLGLSEVRVRDALLRAAGASDLFTRSQETQADAWRENNALTEEAAKRFATTKSQIQLARNEINDFAISIGNFVKGGLELGIKMLGDFAGFINDLPGPLKAVAVGLTAVVGAVSLFGGGMLLLLPRIAATKAALADLNLSAAGFGATLKGLAAGGLTYLAISQVSNAFHELSEAGDVEDAADKIRKLADEVKDQPSLWDDFTRAITDAQAQFGENEPELFNVINEKTSQNILDAAQSARAYSDRLSGLGDAYLEAFGPSEQFGASTEENARRSVEAAEAARDLRLAQLALAGGLLAVESAAIQNRDAERELGDARARLDKLTREGKQGTDAYREATRALREATLSATQSELGLAQSVADYIKEEKDGEVTKREARRLVEEYGKMAGLTKEEVQSLTGRVLDLIGRYKQLPTAHRIKHETPGLDLAVENTRKLFENLKAITGMGTIRAEVQFSGPSGGDIAMAAGGGSPTGMFNYLQAIVPGAQSISSGYRPGDKDSYHSLPGGMHAVDIVGANLTTAYNVAKATFGAGIREMILDHSIYQRGVEGYYAPSDHTGSNRHLHLADRGGFFEGPGMLQMGAGLEYFASGLLPKKAPPPDWWDQFAAGRSKQGGTEREKLADEIADMLTRALRASLKRKFDILGKVLDELSGFITDKLEKDQRRHIQQRIAHFSDLTEVFQDQSEQLRAEFDRLKAKMGELRSSVKGAIKGFVDITAVDLGAIPEGSNVAEVVALQIQEAEDFAGIIKQLAKMGLNTEMLQQIIQTQDIALAEAILAGGKSMVKDLNEAQKAINDLAKDTASFVADKVFGENLEKVEKQFDRFGSRLDRLIGNIEDFNDRMGKLDVGKAKKAAVGFHGDVSSPTMFLAGESGRERVDITPYGKMIPVRAGSGAPQASQTVVNNTYNSLGGRVEIVLDDGQKLRGYIQEAAFDGFQQAARAQGTR